MKKKIFSILQYAIFLGIGIFLTWWQLDKMTDVQKIQFRQSLEHVRYIYLLPVFIITILGHVSRAVRWKILIGPMGYQPKTSNTFYAIMCGYLANAFLPRAGEILRCTLLGRHEKIPVTKLFGTILVERTFDLFCYFILVVFTFLFQIETVSDFVRARLAQVMKAGQIAPVWVVILLIVAIPVLGFLLARWILIRYRDHRLVVKLKGLHMGLKEGFTTILHLKKRRLFLAHTVFIWATYVAGIYIGFSALSATAHLGIGAAFSVLSLVTLAMIVSPGGLGAFPVAVQQVLLIYQVDNISFGWLMWGITTAIVIVMGILCFGLLIYKNRKKHEKERYPQGKNLTV
jgi:uncharacterized protein (TIRG00374 family)